MTCARMSGAAGSAACVWTAAVLCLCAAPFARARELTPDIRQHVLPNGLRVYLLEDRSAPIFTFQYWVEVGSGDEWEGNPGVTGISHFFEHLMFRGTERFPRFVEEITSRGGVLNAFTWLDVTVFWDKLAASHLDFVTDIESDRLRNMRIDFLSVEPEREVVKSERLLRTENDPSGALGEAVGATLFQAHSYRFSTVGWMRDLNAITIEQVRDYHRRFYVPNNAFVVLVGDFEPARALALIRKHYGDFERRPIQRTGRTPEPQMTRQRRVYVEKPTGTGLFSVSYRCPAGAHPDYVHLEVARQLLAGGKTSRLQTALIHTTDPLAKEVSGFMFPFVDEGVLSVEVEMLPEKPNRLAEERLVAEIERLRSEPVPEAELVRAVAQLRGDVVRGMETTNGRGQMIGFSVRATGDPALPWKRLGQYGAVTAGDVMRVARKWLAPERQVVGHAVDPRRLQPLAESLLREHPSDVPGLDALVLDAMAYAAASEAHRKTSDDLRLEEEALALLEKRAGEAKAASAVGHRSEDTRQAIDRYLQEGEKGLDTRRKALAGREKGAREAASALFEQRAGLAGRWEALDQASRRPEASGKRWTTRLLFSGQLLAAVPFSSLGPPPDDPVELGEWALRGLALQHFGGVPAAGIARALAAFLSDAGSSKTASLAAIREYAHEATQVDAGRM